MNEEELIDYNIARKACRWPIIYIAENAGQDGESVADDAIDGCKKT